MFAKELLKKGYIELTEENARMYGYGFSATSITLSTDDSEILRISNHSGREYIDAMNDRQLQEKIDYDREEFKDWNANISLFHSIGTIRKDKLKNERNLDNSLSSNGKII